MRTHTHQGWRAGAFELLGSDADFQYLDLQRRPFMTQAGRSESVLGNVVSERSEGPSGVRSTGVPSPDSDSIPWTPG